MTQTRLCDKLEGRVGVEAGSEVQEEGDICILVADACWCTAETNVVL